MTCCLANIKFYLDICYDHLILSDKTNKLFNLVIGFIAEGAEAEGAQSVILAISRLICFLF